NVHFRSDDPPEAIARKALRVNLSDLAAKGASAHGYLLSLALPKRLTMPWLESFAAGLAADQEQFSIVLLGGDTTATEGPLTIAISAFGTLPAGTMTRRFGAKPGDIVFVTGTIGDSGAGLAVLKDQIAGGSDIARQTLVDRYRVPSPRMAAGVALRGVASAALDVSDGLLADLAHISDVSGVRIEVDAQRVPRSPALISTAGEAMSAIMDAVTAGDDYEIAFTAPGDTRDQIARVALQTGTVVTEIGRVLSGAGVVLLDSAGAEIPVLRKGYTHF
ncbi:MAG TPA: thiamine-phosphate kinase, partial [Rhizomicrobium sp.]